MAHSEAGEADRPARTPTGRSTDPVASQLLLVDAANVIGSRPTGWWRDRPGAARRLVDRIVRASVAGRLSGRVVVVLEGTGAAGVSEGEIHGGEPVAGLAGGGSGGEVAGDDASRGRGGLSPQAGSRTSIHVVHAAGSGDDQLVDLATAAGPTGVGVVVVTADRELRQRIEAVGGSAVGPSWLYGRLGDEA